MPFFLGGELATITQKEREESKRIYCTFMGREGAVFPFKNDIFQKSHWRRCISFVLHRNRCTVISLILLCGAVGMLKKWLYIPVWKKSNHGWLGKFRCCIGNAPSKWYRCSIAMSGIREICMGYISTSYIAGLRLSRSQKWFWKILIWEDGKQIVTRVTQKQDLGSGFQTIRTQLFKIRLQVVSWSSHLT